MCGESLRTCTLLLRRFLENWNVTQQQHAEKTNLFSLCHCGSRKQGSSAGNELLSGQNSICFFTKRGRSKDDDYERTLATDGDFARIVDSAQ